MKIKIQKLTDEAVIPSYANPGDAGLDLTAVSKRKVTADDPPYHTRYTEYGTGLLMEIPMGYVGLLFPRSSVTKTDMSMANSVGVIDSGYRGEVKLRFRTTSSAHTGSYKVGDRVGQIVIMPYPTVEFQEVSDLSASIRGIKGFGSTEKKLTKV